MMKASKLIFLILIFTLILSSGCKNNDVVVQQEYQKCTSVCAAVLGDDFVTLKLCMDECEEKFLEEG